MLDVCSRAAEQSDDGIPQEGSRPINALCASSNVIVEMNKSISVVRSRLCWLLQGEAEGESGHSNTVASVSYTGEDQQTRN